MKIPINRKLRGYAFDPTFSSTLNHRLTNEVIYKVVWEELKPGPIGEYVEVIDYDPTRQGICEGVDLNNPYILADQGLPLSPRDPQFHQQQVYAVAMDIIKKFEAALGRKIIFSRRTENRTATGMLYNLEYVQRLRIYPHAMCQENAYYSPDKVALLFGYFRSRGNWEGNNVPNSVVFTCLSPDIVAHECTHAILDSLMPFLNKDTNPDMLAFHEGFADIIALLQRFSMRQVVFQQIMNSRGDLYSPANMMGDLASQFGRALSGHRKALRSYLTKIDEQTGEVVRITPNPSLYHNTNEPHERGAILVATIFDAFARLYDYRTADLLRIASDGTGILKPGAISVDLANRLTEEVCYIANRLGQICIRALDYCPATDMVFADYLRAIITADMEHNPEDEDGMRYAILEAFRSWGIVPENVNTYSVDSVMWDQAEEYWGNDNKLSGLKASVQRAFGEVTNSIEKILREDNRKHVFEEIETLSARVHQIFNFKMSKLNQGTEKLLGMDFGQIKYNIEVDGLTYSLTAPSRNIFQVYKCRPFIRSRNNRSSASKQIVISFLQKVYVNLKGTPYEGYFVDKAKGPDVYAFRGGASVVVDLSNYEIQYIISKSVCSSNRLKQQLDYALLNMANAANDALMLQENEPFAAIH